MSHEQEEGETTTVISNKLSASLDAKVAECVASPLGERLSATMVEIVLIIDWQCHKLKRDTSTSMIDLKVKR